MYMKRKTIWDSSSDHKRTNCHSGEDQEQGPWFIAKGLNVTVTMKMVVSQRKTSTKQNPNPKWQWLLSLYHKRNVQGLGATRGRVHNLGLRSDTIQRPARRKTGDATSCHGHMEWCTNLLDLGSKPKEASHHQVSNASENTLFWHRMREISSFECRAIGWIRMHGPTWAWSFLEVPLSRFTMPPYHSTAWRPPFPP